jgi:threonyl-tRNA synthetase
LEFLYGGFLTHGPPLTDGFFYDCYLGDKKIALEDYSQIEKNM